MRAAAIDYGRARIGIALTDIKKTIAYPFKTIKSSSNFEILSQNILKALEGYLDEIEIIIVGLPLLLNGRDSDMSKEVRKFVKVFETKTKIPIELFDERLSTAMAEKDLKTNLKLSRKKRSKIIDPISASIILESFINRKK